ncbi:hypothetical protein H4S08_001922 [Coemansia sp. RSA 1365]|nr:hypothetical protein H4S08_001922 [Coemansia sp. RSA 1365]
MLKARTSLRRAATQRMSGTLVSQHIGQKSIRGMARLPSFFLLAHDYHDSTEYGCFSPSQTKPEIFSAEERSNRQENANLLLLANAYRRYGHMASNLDPLGIRKAELLEELSVDTYGLTEESKMYNTKGIIAPSKSLPSTASLSTIVTALRKKYCQSISYEFEHVESPAVRQWFAHYIESMESDATSARLERFHELLAKTEVFEQFLQKKLPSVKRYGLEGSESIVALMDQLIYEATQHGIFDIVTGLSHRGRMSILASLFDYPKDELIRKLLGGSEFSNESPFSGDMLVDLAKPATLSYLDTSTPVNVDILWNACHLESGMPVGMGKSRTKDLNIAKSRQTQNHTIGDHVLPISLHGDSSFAGQGIVAESLGMSGLAHFTNGGTIHIVINNQVGYTTPASHTRTTRYASDIAKFADVPVIHVNGDYPEEMAGAARVAVAYRQKFRRDVVIDVWTFRKRGHNELDEPSFTQPAMYKKINARKSIPAAFEERLVLNGQLTKEKIDSVKTQWLESLNAAFAASTTCNPTDPMRPPGWGLLAAPGDYPTEDTTGVDIATLCELGVKSVTPAEHMKVHPRIERFHIKPRLRKLQEGLSLDWATAEALAFGSLLVEGYNVRLSGQDVGRGTFSQRHAMFVCQETEQVHVPLNHIVAAKNRNQRLGKLEVVNSNLCEEAVVGFEYGVSAEDPFTLAIWEAQFGDFYNNSQTIIDGYIASGEAKWGQQNGLVLLLPHGFDGGGPDHSSCRIERHLQLSNDPVDGHVRVLPNIYMAYPTTPAQFFHLIRRQMKRNFRKPLIVAAPKTMLRLASATSSLSEMSPGTRFQPVLDDMNIRDPRSVKRIMIVSGKLYYDLAKAKSENPLGEHVAIVRVEELSPFPRQELYRVLSRYTSATDFVWVQEEPRNAGAYAFAAPRISSILPKHTALRYVGRSEYAATCSGIDSQQSAEQTQLVQEAFDGLRGLVADLVIDNITIRHGRQHQQKFDKPAAASVMSASVSHRWDSRPVYAAAQSSDH